jgi:hypothetical protein
VGDKEEPTPLIRRRRSWRRRARWAGTGARDGLRAGPHLREAQYIKSTDQQQAQSKQYLGDARARLAYSGCLLPSSAPTSLFLSSPILLTSSTPPFSPRRQRFTSPFLSPSSPTSIASSSSNAPPGPGPRHHQPCSQRRQWRAVSSLRRRRPRAPSGMRETARHGEGRRRGAAAIWRRRKRRRQLLLRGAAGGAAAMRGGAPARARGAAVGGVLAPALHRPGNGRGGSGSGR